MRLASLVRYLPGLVCLFLPVVGSAAAHGIDPHTLALLRHPLNCLAPGRAIGPPGLAVPTAARLGPGQRATHSTDLITDLGTLGGSNSFAYGINERGQVAGYRLTALNWPHAFLWQNGVMTDLETPDGFASYVEAPSAINERGQVVGSDGRRPLLWQDGTMIDLGQLDGPYGYIGLAGAINDAGQVLGTGHSGTGGSHAFVWQRGVMTDLGTLGGATTEVGSGFDVSLNARGQVVGRSETATGTVHAFLWWNGVMTDLGTLLPGGNSYATAINDRGQVAGYGSGGAFLWQDGVMTNLGSLGGGVAYAYGMNNRGQVVGTSTTSTGEYHAFLWQDGAMTDLGTLGGAVFGATGLAINERGQVVGISETPAGVIHPFLWQDGVMSDLGALGGVDQEGLALDINNRGQAVGWSGTADGGIHACLWQVGAKSGWAALSSASEPETGAAGSQKGPGSTERPSRFAPVLRVVSAPGAAPVRLEMRGLPAGSYAASVFDVRGRRVRRWEGFAAGSALTAWDGRRDDGARVGTGMYFLRVEAGGREVITKVLIAR